MKYFIGCTAENIKKRYKELALKFHPDCGGDTEIMKAINAEFDELNRLFARSSSTETPQHDSATEGAEFKEIISKIISINADIEVIGCWIWVFNAYPYKDLLKSVGFKWASKKRAWTWHPSDRGAGNGKKTMSEIRLKYGSEQLKTYSENRRLAAV